MERTELQIERAKELLSDAYKAFLVALESSEESVFSKDYIDNVHAVAGEILKSKNKL